MATVNLIISRGQLKDQFVKYTEVEKFDINLNGFFIVYFMDGTVKMFKKGDVVEVYVEPNKGEEGLWK